MIERAATRERAAVVVGGGVFLGSGAALVVHVLTGSPLALVLAVAVMVGAGLVSLLVWPDVARRRSWTSRIAVGVPVGLVATVAYDLSRYALVQAAGFSASPFAAFPLFGRALVADLGGSGAGIAVGVAFHLLNGVAFGCAYAVWFGHRPWPWGIAFALGLEAFMLAIYPGWLDLRTLREFTTMSVLGHLVYGSVLGLGTSALLRRRSPTHESGSRAGR